MLAIGIGTLTKGTPRSPVSGSVPTLEIMVASPRGVAYISLADKPRGAIAPDSAHCLGKASIFDTGSCRC